MKSKKAWLFLLLGLIVVIGGALILYNSLSGDVATDQLSTPPTNNTAEEDDASVPAPDFTVYDGNGNQVQLSDYFGKPIVLNFWASWCGPCKSEMPEFDGKYRELDGEVVFLMVNMTDGQRETTASAQEYINEQRFAFPVLYDRDMQAAMTYQVYSLPTTYFLDAEGNIVARANGAIQEDTLQKGVDMILP